MSAASVTHQRGPKARRLQDPGQGAAQLREQPAPALLRVSATWAAASFWEAQGQRQNEQVPCPAGASQSGPQVPLHPVGRARGPTSAEVPCSSSGPQGGREGERGQRRTRGRRGATAWKPAEERRDGTGSFQRLGTPPRGGFQAGMRPTPGHSSPQEGLLVAVELSPPLATPFRGPQSRFHRRTHSLCHLPPGTCCCKSSPAVHWVATTATHRC